ncbi:MAG: hypothetical protein C7B46_20515, partial [Sulfobacillus benefaciens]
RVRLVCPGGTEGAGRVGLFRRRNIHAFWPRRFPEAVWDQAAHVTWSVIGGACWGSGQIWGDWHNTVGDFKCFDVETSPFRIA